MKKKRLKGRFFSAFGKDASSTQSLYAVGTTSPHPPCGCEEGAVFWAFQEKNLWYFLPLLEATRGGDLVMVVNQKQLAECLGLSSRRVRSLREEGLFKLTQEGKGYSLEKSIQEYIEYKVNAETGRRASISKEEVQAQHEEVKKQISILKLRKLRRELHEASDVEAFLSDMLIRFKNRLLSVPAKLAMQVAGETDMNQIILTIKRELTAVLEELSEYEPDEIDGQQELSEDELEEEEDEAEE